MATLKVKMEAMYSASFPRRLHVLLRKPAGKVWRKVKNRPESLVSVYAENGDFDNAVRWEQRCLDRKDLPETERLGVVERLALYRAGKPYREDPK